MTGSAAEQSRTPRSGNTLIVYALMMHPLRGSVKDHLYSFRRYSAQHCFYLNLQASREVPEALLRVPFDAVVFHTSFLSQRWSPEAFETVRERAQPLKRLSGVRVALPQDEFLRTDAVAEFVNEFEVDVVCSVAPQTEWPTIYGQVDRGRTRFHRVLTGYLDDRAVERMERMADRPAPRPLDIVYRAYPGAPWLGRHGMLKGDIAAAVEAAAADEGLSVDISTSDDDVLLGDDWYRFLASGRYTIGTEGGASILDRDGSLKARTEAYLGEHPGASFEEVEAACFPGRDGSFGLYALSPRHLEACATRTCQVLVTGDYNGVLEAGRHYLELRPDLSNLESVITAIKRDDRRAAIVDAAHRDIVASGNYTYARFVAEVERVVLGEWEPQRTERTILLYLARFPLADRLRFARFALRDRLSWLKVATVLRAKRARRASYGALERLPRPLYELLRRINRLLRGRTKETPSATRDES